MLFCSQQQTPRLSEKSPENPTKTANPLDYCAFSGLLHNWPHAKSNSSPNPTRTISTNSTNSTTVTIRTTSFYILRGADTPKRCRPQRSTCATAEIKASLASLTKTSSTKIRSWS